jgi:hypothetical protein
VTGRHVYAHDSKVDRLDGGGKYLVSFLILTEILADEPRAGQGSGRCTGTQRAVTAGPHLRSRPLFWLAPRLAISLTSAPTREFERLNGPLCS